MGTSMMPMSTNLMITLPIPMWNPMTYSMVGGVCPSTLSTQVPHVPISIPINAQLLSMT